ncbi:MAG: medium chain dehydrogenase/reductase family protein [Spirochaeta sp.]|jgi:NADPH:quinone reductase-like Zn-dependent oxidoreductase|nr:medium chain dehydrogenase/reductase family protein [Spirochaeta sp.]
MKQIVIRRAGGPEVLELHEAPDPVVGPGEVVIAVRASGINFADLMARMGMYPDAPPFPCVVGYEVAGTVSACGEGVTSFERGDRVMALTRFGGYQDVVAVPATQVFPIPDSLSFSAAAAIPVNYFTAWLALFVLGNGRADDTVLVHNGGGGVGIAAIQLARAAGLTVVTTASSWKHEELRRNGADTCIDYRTEDFVEAVRAVTDRRGVDLILDPLGGPNIRKDLSVLAPLGHLVGFGLSDSVRNGRRSMARMLRSVFLMPRINMVSLFNRNHAIAGLNLGHLWSEMDRLRGIGDEILTMYEAGTISPVVAWEFPLAAAGEAHTFIAERKNLGKVILVP